MRAARSSLDGNCLAIASLSLAGGLAEGGSQVVAPSLLERAAALSPLGLLALGLAHQVAIRFEIAGVVVVAG